MKKLSHLSENGATSAFQPSPTAHETLKALNWSLPSNASELLNDLEKDSTRELEIARDLLAKLEVVVRSHKFEDIKYAVSRIYKNISDYLKRNIDKSSQSSLNHRLSLIMKCVDKQLILNPSLSVKKPEGDMPSLSSIIFVIADALMGTNITTKTYNLKDNILLHLMKNMADNYDFGEDVGNNISDGEKVDLFLTIMKSDNLTTESLLKKYGITFEKEGSLTFLPQEPQSEDAPESSQPQTENASPRIQKVFKMDKIKYFVEVCEELGIDMQSVCTFYISKPDRHTKRKEPYIMVHIKYYNATVLLNIESKQATYVIPGSLMSLADVSALSKHDLRSRPEIKVINFLMMYPDTRKSQVKQAINTPFASTITEDAKENPEMPSEPTVETTLEQLSDVLSEDARNTLFRILCALSDPAYEPLVRSINMGQLAYKKAIKRLGRPWFISKSIQTLTMQLIDAHLSDTVTVDGETHILAKLIAPHDAFSLIYKGLREKNPALFDGKVFIGNQNSEVHRLTVRDLADVFSKSRNPVAPVIKSSPVVVHETPVIIDNQTPVEVETEVPVPATESESPIAVMLEAPVIPEENLPEKPVRISQSQADVMALYNACEKDPALKNAQMGDIFALVNIEPGVASRFFNEFKSPEIAKKVYQFFEKKNDACIYSDGSHQLIPAFRQDSVQLITLYEMRTIALDYREEVSQRLHADLQMTPEQRAKSQKNMEEYFERNRR